MLRPFSAACVASCFSVFFVLLAASGCAAGRAFVADFPAHDQRPPFPEKSFDLTQVGIVGDGVNVTIWMHATNVTNGQPRTFYSVGFGISNTITTADCSIGIYALGTKPYCSVETVTVPEGGGPYVVTKPPVPVPVALVAGNWSVQFPYKLFDAEPAVALANIYGQIYLTAAEGLPGGPPSTVTPVVVDQGRANGTYRLPGAPAPWHPLPAATAAPPGKTAPFVDGQVTVLLLFAVAKAVARGRHPPR
jgi:hypothetical protein